MSEQIKETEIQKMIEEEARRYAFNMNLRLIGECDTDYNMRKYTSKRDFKAGANFAFTQLQHANRWRKVSEELPDNQDIVLVKTDKGCFATAYLHGKESGFIVYGDDAYREFGNIIEWKPIE